MICELDDHRPHAIMTLSDGVHVIPLIMIEAFSLYGLVPPKMDPKTWEEILRKICEEWINAQA